MLILIIPPVPHRVKMEPLASLVLVEALVTLVVPGDREELDSVETL